MMFLDLLIIVAGVCALTFLLQYPLYAQIKTKDEEITRLRNIILRKADPVAAAHVDPPKREEPTQEEKQRIEAAKQQRRDMWKP